MSNGKIRRSLAIILTLVAAMTATTRANTPGSFGAGDGTFLLNGEPYVVKAAELHYPRIPRPYWDNRIKMCKALGMNTICMYVFWNIHETEPGRFDFSGQNDVRHFVELCAANDMNVILRPGPYVCAEWEMGGLPWWLLRHDGIRLRENDPYFLERVDLFEKAVAEQVSDLVIAKGGPIIMVQVENEYGSYGIDKAYVSNIRDMLRRYYGDDVTLFQCDWSSNFLNNGLDDLVWTINFGTGADIDAQFEPLRRARPHAPLMCSEFWSGWFDKWGAKHETRPADDMIAGIDAMLDRGISFSLYMTHGGTNWGHWAGANSPGFHPDVTSYDYDAPISESGQPTPKYFALRDMMARHNDGKPLPEMPETIEADTIPTFHFTEYAPLWENTTSRIEKDSVFRPMEYYGQGYGSIFYSTSLPGSDEESILTINEVHDYAQVFIDAKYVGTLDRRNGDKSIMLPAHDAEARLDILVEAMGRINFGRAINDYKGITNSVTLTVCDTTINLSNRQITKIPDNYDTYASMTYRPVSEATTVEGRMPRGVYRATINIDRPADTFLDLSTFGKGLVYVNARPIGRFWEIGPQQTLYVPGCWLKKGVNEILVFDIVGPRAAQSRGLETPILDSLNIQTSRRHRQPGQNLDLTEYDCVATGELAADSWQQIDFTRPLSGRYLCFEALSPAKSGTPTTVAEIYALDGDGVRLSREMWKVVYADSEDTEHNRTADKAFDLQESTVWQSAVNDNYPHSIVIDLGKIQNVSGLQILPGTATRYRVYLADKPFNL